jgi:diguanylate cyclase (GGDEF)-like protein
LLRLPRLDLSRKLFLGYLPLALLISVTALFSLLSLVRLQRVNLQIVTSDLPLVQATGALTDVLLAQEEAGRRYLRLKDPELLEAFWRRSEEFHGLARRISTLSTGSRRLEAELEALHKEYNKLFAIDAHVARTLLETRIEYSELSKVRHRELMDVASELQALARSRLQEKNARAARFGVWAVRVTVLLCVLGVLLGFGSAGLVTRNIVGSIRKLKLATDRVAEGQFEDLPTVASRDELGELSVAFANMARKLKRLEEIALDANPLTRLPGGRRVQLELERKIRGGVPFAFCLVDLDNFKAYNDRYGYARGNDVLQRLAGILRGAAVGEGDFVGHVGGDDFAVLTGPGRYEELCLKVTGEFDAAIPALYSEEDRHRGTIVGKTRQGQTVSFPLMTVSIAVVTSERQTFASHVEVAEVAAELKEFAKLQPGSKFVVDRRRGETGG